MDDELLTTGQAAQLLGVTVDSVLEWVKSGKLRAERTTGGRYRIARSEVSQRLRGDGGGRVLYCWEFHQGGEGIRDECRKCVTFRSRALHCFELAKEGPDSGHSLRFCETDCEDCEYYARMKGRIAKILLFSQNAELVETLKRQAGSGGLNIEGTGSVYRLSVLVESFRPDFVVVDAEVGAERIREVAAGLAMDRRTRLEGIIVAGSTGNLPDDVEARVSAHIGEFSEISEIIGCVRRLRSAEGD